MAENYDDMSVEDLQKALLDGEGLIVTEEKEVEEPPEPEKAKEEKTEEDKSGPAVKVEEKPKEEKPREEKPKEDKSEPVKAGPTLEEVLSQVELLNLSLEEQKLLQQKAEAKAERERFLHSRAAGEAGYWKKRAETRRPVDEGEDGEPPVREIPPEIEERLDLIQAEQNQTMLEREYNAFTTRRRDHGEYAAGIKEFMQGAIKDPDIAEALNGRDLKLARITVRSLLDQAYLHAKLAPIAEKRKALEERRASQMPGLEEAKKRAAPSGAGATAPAKQKPKAVEDMTAEEANEEMHKLYGGFYGNRR